MLLAEGGFEWNGCYRTKGDANERPDSRASHATTSWTSLASARSPAGYQPLSSVLHTALPSPQRLDIEAHHVGPLMTGATSGNPPKGHK